MKKRYILFKIFIDKFGSEKLHLLIEIFHFLRSLFLNLGTSDLTILNFLIFLEEEIEAPPGLGDVSNTPLHDPAKLGQDPEPSTCPSPPGTYYIHGRVHPLVSALSCPGITRPARLSNAGLLVQRCYCISSKKEIEHLEFLSLDIVRGVA